MFTKTQSINFERLFKFKLSFLIAAIPLFFTAMLSAETIQTQSLLFFDGALKVDVSGNTNSKTGTFTLKIINPATNQPWTDLTAKHFAGTVEMTNMDMGKTKVTVTDVAPGVVQMDASFAMKGPWKLNITIIPTGVDPETKSIEFKVK